MKVETLDLRRFRIFGSFQQQIAQTAQMSVLTTRIPVLYCRFQRFTLLEPAHRAPAQYTLVCARFRFTSIQPTMPMPGNVNELNAGRMYV